MMMFRWLVLPLLFSLAAVVYFYRKISGAVSYFFSGFSKRKRRMISGLTEVILILPATKAFTLWFVVFLHLIVCLVLIDIIAFIVKKVCKESKNQLLWNRIYKSCIVAVLMTAIICGYGRYNIFNVVRTEYNVAANKDIRKDGYKMVVLSDLHYGISLNDSGLQKVADRIDKEKADIVVLDGDIVDESTTKAQMKSAFSILGRIKSTYGVYYVYGNHDKNNYTAEPNYSSEQLADTITKSGIKILEDKTFTINNEVTLIGRADRGSGDMQRKDIKELVKDVDKNQELIVLDHQPADYENVKNAGGDMIISGHTHAGQIWPAGLFASLFHFDELNYGEKYVEQLHAIVTSGIAGWGVPLRTERHSEYVVINIK